VVLHPYSGEAGAIGAALCAADWKKNGGVTRFRGFETIAALYAHFGLRYSSEAEARMRAYLGAKPKGKHGAHRYAFSATGFDRELERARFRVYQERYGVRSET